MNMTGGSGMSEAQQVSMPTKNNKERHEQRVRKITGPVRRVWYKTSEMVSKGTHKLLVDWPFQIICRHMVDYDLLSHTDPGAPYELKRHAAGFENHWEWLAEHCAHGWWWSEHGGNHNFLIYFRYKQDALRFKLICG